MKQSRFVPAPIRGKCVLQSVLTDMQENGAANLYIWGWPW
jgi:hypothetical protein